jgi:hypothetical protein
LPVDATVSLTILGKLPLLATILWVVVLLVELLLLLLLWLVLRRVAPEALAWLEGSRSRLEGCRIRSERGT